jgi:transposase
MFGCGADWAAGRRKPGLRQLGVDEIHLGKKQKFLTVASNLESGEPLWFVRERKKETLDEFFQKELSARQRRGIEAACVDMWEPYRQSVEQWAPDCRIVYDKFHVMQHANTEERRSRRIPPSCRDRILVLPHSVPTSTCWIYSCGLWSNSSTASPW